MASERTGDVPLTRAATRKMREPLPKRGAKGPRGRHRQEKATRIRKSPEVRSRDLSAAVLAACLGSGIAVCVLSSAQAGNDAPSVAAPAVVSGAANIAAGRAVVVPEPRRTPTPAPTPKPTPTIDQEAIAERQAAAAAAAAARESARKAAAQRAAAEAAKRAAQAAADQAAAEARIKAAKQQAAAAEAAAAAAQQQAAQQQAAAEKAAQDAAAQQAAAEAAAKKAAASVKAPPPVAPPAPTKPVINTMSCTRGAGGYIATNVTFSTGGAPGTVVLTLAGHTQQRSVNAYADRANAYMKGLASTAGGCQVKVVTAYGTATRSMP